MIDEEKEKNINLAPAEIPLQTPEESLADSLTSNLRIPAEAINDIATLAVDTPETGETDEQVVQVVKDRMAVVFPQFGVMDRRLYDAFGPNEGVHVAKTTSGQDPEGSGKLLAFYTGEIAEGAPLIQLIFHEGGYTLYYENTPETGKPVRFANNTFYGPSGNKWTLDELDLALEKGKIQMEGIDPEDTNVRNQPIGWSDKEKRVVTAGEKMDAKKTGPKERERLRGKRAWTLFDKSPEAAKQVVLARLVGETYTTFAGKQIPMSEVLAAVEQDTKLGQQILKREMNIIEAHEELLRVKDLI